MRTVLKDVEWAVRYASKLSTKEIPVYLMGQSMGGGIALDFIVNQSIARNSGSVALSSGGSSPARGLTYRRWVVWMIGMINKVLPDMHFATPAVGHDLSVGKALVTDPWARECGTYRSIYDMFPMDYKRWQNDLPLLMLHGTAGDLNLCTASEDFVKKVDASDKRLIL
ncbi:uncharacterized protein STEHIDRAFT_135897 [Stereum hirsutum FP-91666 SS1]|uniref:Serine aminopeptidase S33 domain-containing protein n=1 Tax=Stereum hirsutum (strain FP-91666) TaxID=721885 RepID=R7RVL8_STEHR|nr:uncharacterized protein STEHIDRAFT_135897 [Stereum hirsutum FP-91666 SS1]EIM79146.1 hypothetical protein STEHIDRAFT_135897 [Stereum hirsutum FP-91666 SS1]